MFPRSMWVSQQITNKEMMATQQDMINFPLQSCD